MSRKLLLFNLLCVFSVSGQFKNRDAELMQKFPDEEFIVLNNIEKVQIEIVDNKLTIKSTNSQDNIYLSSKVNAFGGLEREIPYSAFFSEISNIQAATFVPSGRKYDKIVVEDIKTEKSKSRGIFMDDIFEKKFTFKGITKGAITSLSYQESIKDMHMLGSFVFGNYIPIENSEYSISYPSAQVKVGFKTYGKMDGITFDKKEKNGITTLTWKAKDLKSIPNEGSDLNIRYDAPQIIPMIEAYTINGETKRGFSDVDQLFSYYNSLVKDLNEPPSQTLVRLTDSLTVGKSEIEKIKAVYYWVQDNVKYIAFEEGMSGFVPRQPNDVCSKRFGDCKDMANLIQTMLTIAKVPSHLVWIGTRDIPFKYVENPTLSVDNHMIAAVKYKNEWVFLDATDDKIDFGLPTTHIMGKEAMIKTGSESYKIEKVPASDALVSFRKDSAVFKIEKNQLTGQALTNFEGHWKGQLKHQIGGLSEIQKKDFMENYFKVGSNKCKADQFNLQNLKLREKPMSVAYSLKIPDYAKTIAGEVYVNPHVYKHMVLGQEIDIEKRKKSKVEEFKWSEESIVKIEIPSGFEIQDLPKNMKFESPKFQSQINYNVNGKYVEVHQKTKVDTLLIEKSDFESYNKLVNSILDAYNEMISFKIKK